MSANRSDSGFLSDTLVHARLAVRTSIALGRRDLSALDDKTAVIERRIEIVGEAARHVSDAFEAAHPEIPWRQIVGTRHRIAHEYAEIDYDVVWRIVSLHLPALIGHLEPLVESLPPDPEPST